MSLERRNVRIQYSIILRDFNVVLIFLNFIYLFMRQEKRERQQLVASYIDAFSG